MLDAHNPAQALKIQSSRVAGDNLIKFGFTSSSPLQKISILYKARKFYFSLISSFTVLSSISEKMPTKMKILYFVIYNHDTHSLVQFAISDALKLKGFIDCWLVFKSMQ